MPAAKDIFTTETMPVPPFVEGQPHTLIIGTFPPARERWDYAFFFPNKQNRLWNTLARVARQSPDFQLTDQGSEPAEVAARKAILRALNAAMVNIIHRCQRKNGSALDNDLTVEQLEQIVADFLLPHPSIKRIFLTSMSGRNSCLSLLKRHLREQGIGTIPHRPADNSRASRIADPKVFSFFLDGREVVVYSLYSPSPTAMRAGITEADLYLQYSHILYHEG